MGGQGVEATDEDQPGVLLGGDGCQSPQKWPGISCQAEEEVTSFGRCHKPLPLGPREAVCSGNMVGNERVGFGERACRLLERTGRHTKDKRKYAGFGQCRLRQQGGEGMVKG